jgi:hypothetical protein
MASSRRIVANLSLTKRQSSRLGLTPGSLFDEDGKPFD